jgi:hypothetical protein
MTFLDSEKEKTTALIVPEEKGEVNVVLSLSLLSMNLIVWRLVCSLL